MEGYEFWYRQGNSLADSKAYAEALHSYNKGLEFDPDCPTTQYQQRVQIWQAISNLTIESDDYQLWLQRGLILNKLGDYEQAINSFDKALEINPILAEALCHKGSAFLGLAESLKSIDPSEQSTFCWHSIFEAIINYCKALKISSGYLEAQTLLSNTVEKLKKTDAVALCQSSLEIEPDYLSFGILTRYQDLIIQGNERLKAGDDREALTMYNQMHQQLVDDGVFQEGGRRRYCVGNVGSLYNRAVILQNLERLEEAIEAYAELAICFPLFPTAARAWYNRGVALESLNSDEEAVTSYRRALNVTPLYPAAWYRHGVILKSLGNIDEANASLEKAMYISHKFSNRQIEILAIEALESIPD